MGAFSVIVTPRYSILTSDWSQLRVAAVLAGLGLRGLRVLGDLGASEARAAAAAHQPQGELSLADPHNTHL